MRTTLIVLSLVATAITVTLAGTGEEDGACCLSNGQCFETNEHTCELITKTPWHGPGTDCSDVDGLGTPDICEDALQRIFWVRGPAFDKWVYSSQIDGSNVTRLPIKANWVVANPINRRIYWDSISDRTVSIAHSTFDGIDRRILPLETVWGSVPFLDSVGGKIYFVRENTSSIYRANLDGTDQEFVVSSGPGQDMLLGFSLSLPPACHNLFLDTDSDGDIDLEDYAVFQRCLAK